MNLTYAKTKNYEQKTVDNEPTKQTQSKPISMPRYYVGLADSFALRPEMELFRMQGGG